MNLRRIRHRAPRAVASLAVVVFIGMTGQSQAAVTTISTSDAALWALSSTVGIYNTSPWPGATLPDASTFTLPAVAGNTAAGSGIYSGSGVTFYEMAFTLPAFATITGVLTTLADNNMEVFVNGVELAMYGTDLQGFGRPPFALSIGTDGTITNGYAGGSSFSQTASSFPASIWNSGGSNEIEVAVRNLYPNDTGGFVLNFALTTTDATPVPEPASLLLLGMGIAGLGALRRRRL